MALSERSRQGFVLKAVPNEHHMVRGLWLKADLAYANFLSIVVKQPLLGRIGEPDKPP